MIPHEAFDLSNLDDGEGVGSHFGYDTQLWRSYLARRRALLRVVLHFWHWKWKHEWRAGLLFSLLVIFLDAV